MLRNAPVAPVVGFCYVDGSIGKPSEFDTYLLQYKDLFSRLDRFGIIYIAGEERMFPKAERNAVARALRVRDLFERRETSSFGKVGLDRLRDELTEFGRLEYEALYCEWRERDDCILGGGAESAGKRSGGFATYSVDHDYELFGELSRKIPA